MAERWKTMCRAGGFPVLAIILASCGGGSDVPGQCFSPTPAVCAAVGVPRSFPQPVPSPVGLYRGLSSNGRTFASLVLDDNSFYAVYSGINNPSVAGGAIQGTLRAAADTFTITNAIDTNLEGRGAQAVAVEGNFGTKQFLNGSIIYPAANTTISFAANYSPEYEMKPDLSLIAGNYSGSTAVAGAAEPMTLAINGTGTISGQGASGCTFSGTLQPRTSGNAFVLTGTFGAAPCRLPGSTANGIAYFDRSSNTMYTVGAIGGQNASLIAIATKQ